MKNDPNELDTLIKSILDEMATLSPESDEYDKRLKQLERLYKLKTENRPERVSRDTLYLVGGNLLGVLLIVAYEQKNVVTSKALGWINKRTDP